MFMKKYFKSKLCETIRITKIDINLYRTDKSLNSKNKNYRSRLPCSKVYNIMPDDYKASVFVVHPLDETTR